MERIFYAIPQKLLLRLEYGRLRRAACGNVSDWRSGFLLFMLRGAVLPVCNSFFGRGKQINLMEIFTAAHIHNGLFQKSQVCFCYVVFEPGAGIAWPFHECFPLHIKFTDAVDDNMRVDISAFVMPIRVGADKRLVSGKIFCCILQPKFLRPFPGKPFVRIFWIIAYDVVVGFDFIVTPVFAVTCIQLHAFCIKSERVTVYAVQKIVIPELHVFVFIKNWLPGFFIVFENEIPLRFAVIGIFNCYVFQYRHEELLWNYLYIVRLWQSCPPFL